MIKKFPNVYFAEIGLKWSDLICSEPAASPSLALYVVSLTDGLKIKL